MAHEAQRVFFGNVKKQWPEFFDGQHVLEVGSLDINGTVRDFFTNNSTYIGVDVGPGPGVDVVAQGQDLTYDDGEFDVTVSAECFEHNPYWKETFTNMARMTRPGGLVLFTCAGYDRPEHGTARSDVGSSPLTVSLGWDYYRNLAEKDFLQELNMNEYFDDYQFFDNRRDYDLYFAGVRGGGDQYINEMGRLARDMELWLR